MAYEIGSDGSVDLGRRRLPVPKTISAEAQAYLATPPWDGMPMPEMPTAMWESRNVADAAFAQLNDMARAMYAVEVEEITIGGVRCHMVRPRETAPEAAGKVLLNLHGGGFVLGSGLLIEAIPIAGATKIPVIAIDYRLAPEHPYPAAVDDAVAVYRAVLDHHSPADIGVYGTSAGGFITAQLAVRLEYEGPKLPA